MCKPKVIMISKLTENIYWKKKDVSNESTLMADVHVCLCLHVLIIISVHTLKKILH